MKGLMQTLHLRVNDALFCERGETTTRESPTGGRNKDQRERESKAHGGELRGRTLLGRGGVLVAFLLRFGSVSLPEADAPRVRERKK